MTKQEHARKYYLSNKERICARTRAYYEANRDAMLEKQRAYHQANKEERASQNRAWADANRDKMRAYHAAYVKRNRALWTAQSALWRAAKLQATPPWADAAAIREVYKEAARLTQETGTEHHVDHIHPLQSKKICGLHTCANLQILTGDANRRKGNRVALT